MTAVADFENAALRAGRDAGPRMMFDWFLDHRLSSSEVGEVVANVWQMADLPQAHLGVDMWVMFFRMRDGPSPAGPLTLYRGATSGRARGMSWTTDLGKARWFAERFNRFVGDPDVI